MQISSQLLLNTICIFSLLGLSVPTLTTPLISATRSLKTSIHLGTYNLTCDSFCIHISSNIFVVNSSCNLFNSISQNILSHLYKFVPYVFCINFSYNFCYYESEYSNHPSTLTSCFIRHLQYYEVYYQYVHLVSNVFIMEIALQLSILNSFHFTLHNTFQFS